MKVELLKAAIKLHEHLASAHWDGQALIGPDVGVRFNYRVGRFVKSLLSIVDWNDNYYYVQGQGYWVLDNWQLLEATGDECYRDMAVRASESMLGRQRSDGAWIYPNREWKGRIATAEGTWGAIGLLESYRYSGEPSFLDGALKWHDFMTNAIGYQRIGEALAVNYFAGRGQALRVPNNSAFVLRFLAELARTTGDHGYLQPVAGLAEFLAAAQTDAGEFPYSVPGTAGGKGRVHFQCYQYNAFQCLDLMRYYELTGDELVRGPISRVLRFLSTAAGPSGQAHYQCDKHHATVTYHTAVVAAALTRGTVMGFGEYRAESERSYEYLLGLQRPDGSFPHSSGDYHWLMDGRSYPRHLAMLLNHLLVGASSSAAHVPGKAGKTREDTRDR